VSIYLNGAYGIPTVQKRILSMSSAQVQDIYTTIAIFIHYEMAIYRIFFFKFLIIHQYDKPHVATENISLI